jgi:hypothetical protein
MKGILAGKSLLGTKRSSLTMQTGRAISAVARFAGERLCCPDYFDVADAAGSSPCIMAAGEHIPSVTPVVVHSVREQR